MADCGDNQGYGNLYGGLYGDCLSEFEAMIISRLLMFTRQDANLPLFTRIFSTRTEANINLAAAVSESFDISSAEGDRLDILGTILQATRGTLTDDQYRKRLQIQVDILLTSGGTASTIIGVIETWTGIDPAIYTEIYPAAFIVSAQVPLEEVNYLGNLVQLAKPGGVDFSMLAAPLEDGLICDSVVVPIVDAGFMGSAAEAIAGEKLLGTVYS